MEECFKCGVTDQEVRLFDVILDEGIVKGCNKCIQEEDLPVVKRPTTSQLKEAERKSPRVYDKLKKISGFSESAKRSVEKQKEDISLKNIVDRNYVSSFREDTRPRTNLIENFHWIVMRARRKKHLTHKQVAEQIGEAEMAVKMAEQGKLPEDYDILIKKLENFFGIILRKDYRSNNQEIEKKSAARILEFNPAALRGLTIEDLKEMKKQREAEIFEDEVEEEIEESEEEKLEEMQIKEQIKKDLERSFQKEKPLPQIKKNEILPENSKNEDLSQDDINKIIFGR